jgi:acetolactate synthase-1/2/3 large subunit
VGGDLSSPDFVRYAEAFGARGVRVDALEALHGEVARALELEGPTLIEAPCPQAVPPWIETPAG